MKLNNIIRSESLTSSKKDFNFESFKSYIIESQDLKENKLCVGDILQNNFDDTKFIEITNINDEAGACSYSYNVLSSNNSFTPYSEDSFQELLLKEYKLSTKEVLKNKINKGKRLNEAKTNTLYELSSLLESPLEVGTILSSSKKCSRISKVIKGDTLDETYYVLSNKSENYKCNHKELKESLKSNVHITYIPKMCPISFIKNDLLNENKFETIYKSTNLTIDEKRFLKKNFLIINETYILNNVDMMKLNSVYYRNNNFYCKFTYLNENAPCKERSIKLSDVKKLFEGNYLIESNFIKRNML